MSRGREPRAVREGRGLIRLRMRDHGRAARDLERALRRLPAGSTRAARQAGLDVARAGLGDAPACGSSADLDPGEGPTS